MSGLTMFEVLIKITGFWIALYGFWTFLFGFAIQFFGYEVKSSDEPIKPATAGPYYM